MAWIRRCVLLAEPFPIWPIRRVEAGAARNCSFVESVLTLRMLVFIATIERQSSCEPRSSPVYSTWRGSSSFDDRECSLLLAEAGTACKSK